jgi:hypothetical protein
MRFKKRTRIGGRGCPRCGSHDSKSTKHTASRCNACGHEWTPCVPGCRGYRLDVPEAPGKPRILGCSACGVPDHIAGRWPEAWRAMAHRLTPGKIDEVELADPA